MFIFIEILFFIYLSMLLDFMFNLSNSVTENINLLSLLFYIDIIDALFRPNFILLFKIQRNIAKKQDSNETPNRK